MSGQHKHLEMLEITPRGFLGNSLGDTVKVPKNTSQRYAFSGPEYLTQSSRETVSNPNIDSIFKHFQLKPNDCKCINFIENLVQVSIDAFGLSSFLEWYILQHKSPVTSELHINFLNETIDFIIFGERKTPLITWIPILSLSENAGNYTVVNNNIIDKIDKAGIKTVKEAIICWISKPGGVSDFVLTLSILFGRVD